MITERIAVTQISSLSWVFFLDVDGLNGQSMDGSSDRKAGLFVPVHTVKSGNTFKTVCSN